MFPANHNSPEVLQPGNGAFDNPAAAVATQFSSVLPFGFLATLSVWTDQINTAISKAVSQGIRIICTISNQKKRLLRQDRLIQRLLNQLRFVRGRACQVHSERNTLAARHHHKLCTLSTFGFSHAEAPFFAGEKVPSANISIQLIWPCSSSSWIKAIQAASQTPCSSQSRRRRQQVLADGKRSGKSRHRAPLRSTQRMPSKTGRLPMGLGPPLGEACGGGSNGSTFFHCSSVNRSSLAIEKSPFDNQVNINLYVAQVYN